MKDWFNKERKQNNREAIQLEAIKELNETINSMGVEVKEVIELLNQLSNIVTILVYKSGNPQGIQITSNEFIDIGRKYPLGIMLIKNPAFLQIKIATQHEVDEIKRGNNL